MATKSSDSDRKFTRLQWLKWKWEAVRRNPDYKATYPKVHAHRKKEGQFPCEWEKKKAREFGLPGGCLIDPAKSFDDIITFLENFETDFWPPKAKKTMNVEDYKKSETTWVARYKKFNVDNPYCEELHFIPPTFWSYFCDSHFEPRTQGFKLEFDVDLTRVKSLGQLKKELASVVSFYVDMVPMIPTICQWTETKTRAKKGYDRIFANGDAKKGYDRIFANGDRIEALKLELGEDFTFKKAVELLYPDVNFNAYDDSHCENCRHNKENDEHDVYCKNCKHNKTDLPDKAASKYQITRREYLEYLSLISDFTKKVTYP